MKAPEAPDKIYIQPSTIDELPRQNIVYTKRLSDTSVEYIRKKSLLEKLEKVAAEYKKRSDEGELVWQNMCGINRAIDILNKM